MSKQSTRLSSSFRYRGYTITRLRQKRNSYDGLSVDSLYQKRERKLWLLFFKISVNKGGTFEGVHYVSILDRFEIQLQE